MGTLNNQVSLSSCKHHTLNLIKIGIIHNNVLFTAKSLIFVVPGQRDSSTCSSTIIVVLPSIRLLGQQRRVQLTVWRCGSDLAPCQWKSKLLLQPAKHWCYCSTSNELAPGSVWWKSRLTADEGRCSLCNISQVFLACSAVPCPSWQCWAPSAPAQNERGQNQRVNVGLRLQWMQTNGKPAMPSFSAEFKAFI